MEYDLGRDGRRREESDQPEPLDPAIVDRCLSQVEQTVIPFDEPPHHGDEWHSVLSVLMLGGRVSTSDIQRRVARPLQRVRFRTSESGARGGRPKNPPHPPPLPPLPPPRPASASGRAPRSSRDG